MRRFLPAILLIIIVLSVYPFIGSDGERKPLKGMPWQIDLLADGNIKVFDLVPGVSTLKHAESVLGENYELAIVSDAGGRGLEMYFDRYRAGLMAAKIVIGVDVDDVSLRDWQQRAENTEYMQSGTARKASLAQQDVEAAMQTTVSVITFIPAVNLDDEIIRKRFGEPAEVLSTENGVNHYLYPAKGLDIALSDAGKEVLQYVAPNDFARLRTPLLP